MMNQNKGIGQEQDLRPCVGIVLFNSKGQVWQGRRAKKADNLDEGEASLWQFPQGGIEQGEEPLAAAKRELWEETGIKFVHLLAESSKWLTYRLPYKVFSDKQAAPPFAGRYRGQKQKWFAFLFTGEESEITVNPPLKADETEFNAWRWCNLTKTAEHIISFKRDIYEQIATEFAPIAGRLRRDGK